MPPQRILFIRPDTYGDLFLFEPVPRLVRRTWPHAEVGVLIRKPYEDVGPVLEWDGVRLLTTDCNPSREGPDGNRAALAALRDAVQAFEPDCVVAACATQTWLESAVATFAPGARQISLGQGLIDPLARAALDREIPVDWAAIYPEKVLVETELREWDKNMCLAKALLGPETPRWWPVARVPAPAGERAAQILAELNLAAGNFVACAAAGTVNVQIKSWPAIHYGEMLAWLEREHGIRALLIGHAVEREPLEAVREAARAGGASPALWLGQDGEMPIVAGLLAAARFYFGNDTGAVHLAAALGRPVCSIFGGGHWPRFAPTARRSLTVVQPLPCFGCAWDCLYAEGPCVRTIAPASVQRALEQFLRNDTDGRTVFEAEGLGAGARALIDAATPKLKHLREDSADRLRQVYQLTAQLTASEADRTARLGEIEALGARLQESEADRLARLEGVAALGTRLQASETDRAKRLEQIEALSARLQASEAECAARLEEIEALGTRLQASEADRAARLEQIEALSARLRSSETESIARFNQIEQLTTWLRTSEADRAARLEQIEQLTTWLRVSEGSDGARDTPLGEPTGQREAISSSAEAEPNATETLIF